MLFAKYYCKCKIIKCNLQITLQHFHKILIGGKQIMAGSKYFQEEE